MTEHEMKETYEKTTGLSWEKAKTVDEHDSGHREQLGGAVREHTYLPYELIYFGAFKTLAARLEMGAKKYGEFNWQKGDHKFYKDVPRHMIEHTFDYMQGNFSEDGPLDHLGAIMFGAMVLCWRHDQHIKSTQTTVSQDRRFVTVTEGGYYVNNQEEGKSQNVNPFAKENADLNALSPEEARPGLESVYEKVLNEKTELEISRLTKVFMSILEHALTQIGGLEDKKDLVLRVTAASIAKELAK